MLAKTALLGVAASQIGGKQYIPGQQYLLAKDYLAQIHGYCAAALIAQESMKRTCTANFSLHVTK